MTHKQVIIIRKDLKMRRGKEIAQGAHASMGALLSVAQTYINTQGFEAFGGVKGVKVIPLNEDIKPWLTEAFTKICCKVDSEEELLSLRDDAQEAGLIHCLIKDNGQTEFNNVPTYTALAIGPGRIEDIDKVCSKLQLY